jgi:hypothetical protein
MMDTQMMHTAINFSTFLDISYFKNKPTLIKNELK